jgi:hypothetical protein
MKWLQQAMVPGLACLLACAARAEEPATVPAADQAPARMLTLGSPMIRSTMDRVKLAWLFPASAERLNVLAGSSGEWRSGRF